MLEYNNNSVLLNGKEIFSVDEKKKVLSLGIGNAVIKSDRGFFTIMDKPLLKNFYVDKHEIAENQMIFYLKALDEDVKLIIAEYDNTIKITLDNPDNKYDRCRLYFRCQHVKGVYGFGETFAKFNLLGHKVKVWVQEHIPFKHFIKKALFTYIGLKTPMVKFEKYSTYMAQPTFITSDKSFVHIDTKSYCVFNFRNKKKWHIEIWDTKFGITISKSKNYKQLMEELTKILGRMPKVPEWVYDGIILGIQDGTEVCDKKLNNMLDNGVKVSGIWAQDWEGQRLTAFGKQLFWDWKVDAKLYSDLGNYIKKWKNQGVRFLGYINPFLAVEGELYKEAQEKGYLVMDKEGKPYLVKITTFPAAMIDLTNPETCIWIKNIIKDNMIGIGLRGWMADFGEYLPADAVLHEGKAVDLHNHWPVYWAKVNREAIKESNMEDEIFFFTRAGSTGTGKHTSMMWNGDQHVDWSRDYGLGSIVNSQLSLAASGIGASHSDIGGYTTFARVKRSEELMLRWLEMSAFSPVMRTHEGNQPHKNIHFDTDEDIIKAFAKFTNIYVELSPYLKDIINEAVEKGMPTIRPIFFHYEDSRFYDTDDSYMLGADLLVCPVVKRGQKKRTIELPMEKWVHIFTGKEYEGGKIKMECPIGTPAVFYRKDSEYAELFKGIKKIK